MVPGRKGVGFFEILAAFDIDIKEVGFSVLSNLSALPVKDIGGVVDPALPVPLGNAARRQIDPVFFCDRGQGLPGGTALGLRVEGEIRGLIGAGEHLGQGDQVHAL